MKKQHEHTGNPLRIKEIICKEYPHLSDAIEKNKNYQKKHSKKNGAH